MRDESEHRSTHGNATRSRRVAAPCCIDRLVAGGTAFALLTRLAGRRERITYADFAFALGLGSPRNLGWLLTPLLRWCEAAGHPPLPIIVVRRADRLPSGGYDPETIASETKRVFAHDWTRFSAPGAADLAPHAISRRPLRLFPSAPSRSPIPC